MIKKTLLVLSIILLVAVVGLRVNNQVQAGGDLDALKTRGSEVDTDHGSFQVHDFKEGPALVFPSGLGTTTPYHDFKPLWDELQKTHRIVILERPGYGYNQTFSKDKAIGTMVQGIVPIATLGIVMLPVVEEEGNPSTVERNVQYMVGRLVWPGSRKKRTCMTHCR